MAAVARPDPGTAPRDPDRALPPTVLDELPAGTAALLADRWRAAEAGAEWAGLRPPTRDLDSQTLAEMVAAELTAPMRLEQWPSPTRPRPVGSGWIHDEVIDDDRSAFEAILASRTGGSEAIARACQELRFPVTPYRSIAAGSAAATDTGDGPVPTVDDHDPPAPPDRGRPVRVVDLSTHWAGPLATMLLADAGAEVVKVDPGARPDGFRARRGLYHHLNHGKEIVDLDLRQDDQRARFEALVARADLLVESFSRRVLANLGYGFDALADLNSRLAVLSIKAFPAGSPEAEWLAYGPGVHAASGLGLVSGRPVPAPVAYPDVVAGVTAYGRAVDLLAGRPLDRTGESGGEPTEPVVAEVSLAGSIQPLVGTAAHDGDRSPGRTP